MKIITQPETGATIYMSPCGASHAFKSMAILHITSCAECRGQTHPVPQSLEDRVRDLEARVQRLEEEPRGPASYGY